MSKFIVKTYPLIEEGDDGDLVATVTLTPENYDVTDTEIIYRVGGGTSLRVTYIAHEVG